MCLVKRLHLGRSCTSSSDKSFLMLSNHLRVGLSLLLFPGTSTPITLFPTYSSSLLETCPYHFNLLSCTFLDVSAPYTIAGLTTVLYNFPLTLKLILQSHRIPDILFQFFLPSFDDNLQIKKCVDSILLEINGENSREFSRHFGILFLL